MQTSNGILLRHFAIFTKAQIRSWINCCKSCLEPKFSLRTALHEVVWWRCCGDGGDDNIVPLILANSYYDHFICSRLSPA